MQHIKAISTSRRVYDIFALKDANTDVYKARIITALYNTGAVQAAVKRICFRHYIHEDTEIHQDITQETFYQLSKKNADEIIEIYERDASKLIGLCVRIAILNGVAKKGDRPYSSIAGSILFASRLKASTGEVEDQEDTAQDTEDLIKILPPAAWEILKKYAGKKGRKPAQYHALISNLATQYAQPQNV